MLSEYVGLVLLTYVSTIENHDMHVYGFTVFITAALLHMVSACVLYARSRERGSDWSDSERFSYRYGFLPGVRFSAGKIA